MALLVVKFIMVCSISTFSSLLFFLLIYPIIDPPKYFGGNVIAFSCMAAQTILVILLRILLARENKRRTFLTDSQKEKEIEKHGGADLVGDRHPSFRYVL